MKVVNTEYLVENMFGYPYMMRYGPTNGLKNKPAFNRICMSPRIALNHSEKQPPKAMNTTVDICSTLSKTGENKDFAPSEQAFGPVGPAYSQ